MSLQKITVKTRVQSNLEKTWDCWTNPAHIVNWNFASDDWHCPKADNHLQEGGTFSYTMASKDGAMSFDFSGKFSSVDAPNSIHYLLDDGRTVEIEFSMDEDAILVTETFEAETQNSIELQQFGWQAILDNFKKYVEK